MVTKTSSGSKAVVKRAIGVGCSTLASRLLGIVREVLIVRYMGVNALSDAFAMANTIPNALRKIFAEGALSAALIPTFVRAMRTNKKSMVDSLMLLSLIVFEGLVLGICALVMWQAPAVVHLMGPGFSVEQVNATVPLLRILMPFIFFISSSAVFGSALQSVNHFFIPAISPALMNVVYICSLALCLAREAPIGYFCYCMLFAGLIQLIVHIITYVKLNFSFDKVTRETWKFFAPAGMNFLFCMVSIGMSSEISLIIDKIFASYLQPGSLSLINYSSRFMGIPLGIFASALSTTLLPHLSRVGSYAPKRLGFYLVEATKIVFWVTIPMMLVMGFLSEKIFHTIFLSSKFSLAQVIEARNILIAFLLGLFSLSLNKILLSMYYARHVMWLPALISAFGAGLNIVFNILLVGSLKATGIALGTSCAACAQTVLLVIFLRTTFGYKFYAKNFFAFVARYCLQLVLFIPLFWLMYEGVSLAVGMLPVASAHFLLFGIGFWSWVAPLCAALAALVYATRRRFGVSLYFLG